MKCYFVPIILLCALCWVNSKRNILLYAPGYGGSHIIFHTRMADAIAKAGYNVVSFEPEMPYDPANFEGSKMAERFVLSGLLNLTAQIEQGEKEDYQEVFARMFESDSILDTYKFIKSWQSLTLPYCEQIIMRQAVLERLRAYKFDAIVYEPLFLCATGIAHLLGIKTQIFITSLPLFEYATDLMGLPYPASHVPSIIQPAAFTDQMGYFDRFWNILAVEFARKEMAETKGEYNAIFRKHHGPDFPDLEGMAREASLCFVEADEFLDFPRPFQSNVIPLGPFGLDEENGTLEEPFHVEMGKGQNGVALISLGTHASTRLLPGQFVDNLLRAIASRPDIHFLMKVDKEDVANMSLLVASKGLDNLFITGWMPQAKLLAHPNLRLFMSHAGFNSLMEAAYYGVPVVGIPLFVDQLRNAHLAVRNGWGIIVKRQTLLRDYSPLAEAINQILTYPSFKRTAERTRRLIRNKPMSGEERLKANLDLLFLHGDGDLPEWKSAARHMSPWAYHNLDIFIPLFLLAQICLFLLTKFLIFLFQKMIAK